MSSGVKNPCKKWGINPAQLVTDREGCNFCFQKFTDGTPDNTQKCYHCGIATENHIFGMLSGQLLNSKNIPFILIEKVDCDFIKNDAAIIKCIFESKKDAGKIISCEKFEHEYYIYRGEIFYSINCDNFKDEKNYCSRFRKNKNFNSTCNKNDLIKAYEYLVTKKIVPHNAETQDRHRKTVNIKRGC